MAAGLHGVVSPIEKHRIRWDLACEQGWYLYFDDRLDFPEIHVRCYWGQHYDEFKLMTVDHIIPRWRGGTTDPDNVVLACAFCNQNRNRRDLPESLPVEEQRRRFHAGRMTKRRP